MKRAFTPTGIDILGSIPWGTHLSLFYETKQDFLDIVVPYFRTGLENNEFCFWILPPLVSEQEALEALKRRVPDFHRHLALRNIELVSDDEWYMKGGSLIEIPAAVDRFNKKLRTAIARRYVGLRANGGAVSFQKTKRLRELERELDAWMADKKIILLCSFSLRDSDSSAVLDAVRAHQVTAALRDGSWEIIETHKAGEGNSLERTGNNVDAPTRRLANLSALTQREHAVLAQIVAGASNKEAARRLGISPRTIEFHRANILQKLKAKNVAELVRIVLAA